MVKSITEGQCYGMAESFDAGYMMRNELVNIRGFSCQLHMFPIHASYSTVSLKDSLQLYSSLCSSYILPHLRA